MSRIRKDSYPNHKSQTINAVPSLDSYLKRYEKELRLPHYESWFDGEKMQISEKFFYSEEKISLLLEEKRKEYESPMPEEPHSKE